MIGHVARVGREGGGGRGEEFFACVGEEREGAFDLGVEGVGCGAEGEDAGVVGLVDGYCRVEGARELVGFFGGRGLWSSG